MVSRGIWDKYLEQYFGANFEIFCLYYKAEKFSLLLTLTRVIIIDPRPKITVK